MPVFPPMPDERFFRHAVVSDVIDGDTIDVTIDLGWSTWLHERLRLEFVNTPETRGDAEREAGRFVSAKVAEWLPPETAVVIASMAFDRSGRVRGKYGRTVAHVYHAAEGWNLNARLLDPAARLAWETNDNGSLVEARDLTVLTGLPPELRGG